MKFDQSAVGGSVIVVVLKDFEHREETLLSVLKNVANNGDRLVIIHGQDSVEKLDAYVAMCCEWKCDALLIKDDDVVKCFLRNHIELKDITNLVVGVEADDGRYSEIKKSLNSETALQSVQTEARRCNIWFITCNGDLTCTSHLLPRSIGDLWITRILRMSGNNHLFPSPRKLENNTGADDNIPERLASVLEMVETTKKEYDRKFQEVRLKRSNLKKERASHANSPSRHSGKSPSRHAKGKEKEKSCQRELQDAKDEMSKLGKQIKEMQTAINILKQIIIQEPEAAVTEAGGLYEKNEQQSATTLPTETVNTEFSKDEIGEARKRLGNILIGKGKSGSDVYKGLLHNTTAVAIKMLDRESMQGESDFIQKVGVLGRVRHQNLVTLIGVCREVFGLVYEFLPDGSLQDRLECRNEMPPLIWQVRTKIIREICRVLIFLHSNKPQPVVHGNLKASKVLLDDYNFAIPCKLEAFDISQSNGKPTTEHDDLHSFGIIVLQLLTGSSSPEKVFTVVDEKMKIGEEFLHTVLDHTAGNWPTKLAIQLAHMGLRCARLSREERPDLAWDYVWKVLESAVIFIRRQDDDDADAAPEYFKCPLSWCVMSKPHFASDGYTYDLKEIEKWIHTKLYAEEFNGEVLSPMTQKGLKSFDLTPNWALNSEIQQWNVKHPRQVRSIVSDPNPVQSNQQRYPNTSAASARSHRPNPLPSPVTPSPTFLPPPTGIRRRQINGRLPSSSTEADVPGPGESSRIHGKLKHE